MNQVLSQRSSITRTITSVLYKKGEGFVVKGEMIFSVLKGRVPQITSVEQ